VADGAPKAKTRRPVVETIGRPSFINTIGNRDAHFG
jgi:hypothetical protein